MTVNSIFCLICMTLPFFIVTVLSKKTPIRVVEEPTSFGNSFQSNFHNPNELHKRVDAANFIGPEHLKHIYGRCFTLIDNAYKYSFCPFDNVTQHEQNFRWNPYNGILGVWSYWETKDGYFQSMIFKNGDDCNNLEKGAITRSVKVHLLCGTDNNVTKVWEPTTCNYELNFSTPLVCHKDSLLIYPMLNQSLRKEIDEIENDLESEILSKEGYKARVKKVYIEAGIIKEQGNFIKEVTTKSNTLNESLDKERHCGKEEIEELRKLRRKVKNYEQILRENNITFNNT
ncbi:DgyrCDS4602 [Dimorphilus gyrociliatus]|uniref:DgyrCDS4602 n=1 Tax=Dimorphilus gyrociliatus TaxID=2664684 RepID=A0A7I8VH48_9ANNE|nr:DgyrCDS4602 [Dimorphilus gyrociliatus]